jgi:ribosomal protein S6--L-glutamate ligase
VKPTILVVNGERDWGEWFARVGDVAVERRALQSTSWLLRDGALRVYDADGVVCPDAILWRVGAIRMIPRYRSVVELMRLADVPAVNSGDCIGRCFDRLGCAAEMKAAGLPIVLPNAAVGDGIVGKIAMPAPFVVKAGNHHAGLGKTLVDDDARWPELAGLLFAVDDAIAAEPYVPHVRDIRCLIVGDDVWAMVREGRGWRANVDTRKHALIDPPAQLAAWTRRARDHLRADVLGLDFLERADGSHVLLECNDSPGLSGFPERTRLQVAESLLRRLRS